MQIKQVARKYVWNEGKECPVVENIIYRGDIFWHSITIKFLHSQRLTSRTMHTFLEFSTHKQFRKYARTLINYKMTCRPQKYKIIGDKFVWYIRLSPSICSGHIHFIWSFITHCGEIIHGHLLVHSIPCYYCGSKCGHSDWSKRANNLKNILQGHQQEFLLQKNSSRQRLTFNDLHRFCKKKIKVSLISFIWAETGMQINYHFDIKYF